VLFKSKLYIYIFIVLMILIFYRYVMCSFLLFILKLMDFLDFFRKSSYLDSTPSTSFKEQYYKNFSDKGTLENGGAFFY